MLEADAETWVLNCYLKAQPAETHAAPLCARSTATRGANHTHSRNFAHESSLCLHVSSWLSVLCVVFEFVNASVDVVHVEFFCVKLTDQEVA